MRAFAVPLPRPSRQRRARAAVRQGEVGVGFPPFLPSRLPHCGAALCSAALTTLPAVPGGWSPERVMGTGHYPVAGQGVAEDAEHGAVADEGGRGVQQRDC